MATFEENLRKIRGEAIYGPDMREAIAEGIEQAGGEVSEKIVQYKREINSVVSGYETRLDTIAQEIDTRELFINLISIGNDNYNLEVVNAS